MNVTRLIHVPTGRTGYQQIVQEVYQYGQPRTPRGQKTFDAGHVVIVLETPFDSAVSVRFTRTTGVNTRSGLPSSVG